MALGSMQKIYINTNSQKLKDWRVQLKELNRLRKLIVNTVWSGMKGLGLEVSILNSFGKMIVSYCISPSDCSEEVREDEGLKVWGRVEVEDNIKM